MPRKLRIFLIVTLCLLALPVIALMFENWRGKHAWESYKAKLEAQGEHLDFSYYIPPPVPDEKNFMLNPVFAPLFEDPASPKTVVSDTDLPLDQISVEIVSHGAAPVPVSKGGWSTGMHRDDLEAWQAYYRASLQDVTLDKSPAEDVLAALARYDGTFAGLRDAAKTRPLSCAPVKYESGLGVAFRQYSVMQSLLRVLVLRAHAELELNRPDDAFADLELGFRFLGSIENNPLAISGLVRIGWINILLQPVWDGIASHRWTDEQLGKIQDELLQLDFLADYERTMRGERAWANTIFGLSLLDPADAAAQADPGNKSFRMMMAPTRYFPGLIYQNQLSQNRLIQEKILSLTDVKTQRFDAHAAKKNREYFESSRNFSPYSFLSRMSLPAYLGIAQKDAQAQTYVNEAFIACAIERYRLAQGNLPATLDDLHIAELPHDIINGEPLHYHVTGDDYLLYSIGWNETDDGGKVALKSNSTTSDPDQGDWVWSLKPL